MFNKIFAILVSVFLLSGCVDGFRGYFKKSANNKLIDMKGAKAGKRAPLYNKKYVALAKRNIINEDLDDDFGDDDLVDDLYSEPNPYRSNRQMYSKMVRDDRGVDSDRRLNRRYEDRYGDNYDDRRYPSLADADRRSKGSNTGDEDVQKELAEIKSTLNDAKKDLAKYKCPMQQQVDEKTTAVKPKKTSGPVAKSSPSKKVDAPKPKLQTEDEAELEEQLQDMTRSRHFKT